MKRLFGLVYREDYHFALGTLWSSCTPPQPVVSPFLTRLTGKKSILFIAPYEVVTARSSSLLCAQFRPVVMWNILMMTVSIARRLPTHALHRHIARYLRSLVASK